MSVIIVCTQLLAGSRHFLASSLKFMTTVEVSHKAAGVRSSSKITDTHSYIIYGLASQLTSVRKWAGSRDYLVPRPSPHHCFQYSDFPHCNYVQLLI